MLGVRKVFGGLSDARNPGDSDAARQRHSHRRSRDTAWLHEIGGGRRRPVVVPVARASRGRTRSSRPRRAGGGADPAATPATREARLPDQSHGEPHPQRLAHGRGLRERSPRRAIGRWSPAGTRADPIDLLVASGAGRIPELLPIRYGRMLASPFAFFRGAAALMAHDLSTLPCTGIDVVACGDAHLVNFGGFATPERRLVFDINDFDEVAVAPWEWDVRRLVTSFVVAARANAFRPDQAREAAIACARAYREHMARYSEMPVLEAYYESIDLKAMILGATDADLKNATLRRIRKAQAESAHLKEYTRLAVQKGEAPRIRDEPPLVYHDPDLQRQEGFEALARAMLDDYISSLPAERRLLVQRYRLADVAIKVVGVGSVGTYCGIALMVSGAGDPLFLQFKEARPSVLEAYCGRMPMRHHGERVVFGQRLLQASSDIFLGWMTGRLSGRHFYVRQLRDAKIKPVVEVMRPGNLVAYAGACGWALARAHKRSADAVRITGYLGAGDAFDLAMGRFAAAYADQNERDHAALLAAVRSGRLEARLDV